MTDTALNGEPTSRSWRLVPYFEDVVRDAREVLNLGSGDGYLSEYLASRPGYGANLKITDIDVADHSTRGRRPLLFDGETLPFGDASFDVTLCMYVLHHTPEPDRIISEIRRVTRRAVIVSEDLAETPIDRALCLYHAIRFDRWNTRSGRFGFRTLEGWRLAFSAKGLRLARSIRLPRFSHLTNKFYPVRRGLMIFTPEGGP